MRAHSLRLDGILIALGCAAVALVSFLGGLALGPLGLLLPLGAVAALVLVLRPAWAVGLLVGLVVVVERDEFLLPGASVIYAGAVTPVDVLLALAVAGVVLDAQRRGGASRLPVALAVPLGLLALAMVLGVVTGLFAGASLSEVLIAGRQLPYLLLVPLLVLHVVRDERQARLALGLVAALALVKALLGLAAVAAGRGVEVEGSTITFYEPAANALTLLVLLGVAAALLLRARPPWWLLLGSPLLLAALALSFRRSFWIAAALGLVILVALGLSPVGRRLIVPAGLLVAIAIWSLGSVVGFQVQGPLAERAESLEPSRVAVNAEDRYRFDERANVVAEIERRPVTGLGLGVPWSASARPLGVDHGRDYVHVAVLWHWLKLGFLGFLAYLAFVVGAGRLAWLAWRRHPEATFRAAGLAALCWVVALAVVETTASFTGVDLRFTVFLGVVLGFLAAVRPPDGLRQ